MTAGYRRGSTSSWATVVYYMAVWALLECACSPIGDNGDDNQANANGNQAQQDFSASIAGTLFVHAEDDDKLVLEQEINDTVDRGQFIGSFENFTAFTIVGAVSFDDGDSVDAYEFVAPQNIHLQVTLSIQQRSGGAELALGVYDGQSSSCTLTGMEDQLVYCFADGDNLINGDIDVEGTFVVVVNATVGSADYQLDLETNLKADQDTSREFTRGAAAGSGGARVADEFLVMFNNGVPLQRQHQIITEHGLQWVEQAPSGVVRVRHAGAQRQTADDQQAVIRQLASHSAVDVVEPNHLRFCSRIPSDKSFSLQWNYDVLKLAQAWDLTVGSQDILVAVVDTGVVSAHPDLSSRLTAGYDFIADPVRARDGDGRDADPEDVGDQRAGPGLSSFHGTYVAGVIGAATDNGKGIAGVTWQAQIMPLRAIGAGGGTVFDISEAVRYAAGLQNISGELPERPAAIINESLGGMAGEEVSACEQSAIEDASAAGALIIAAAGNEGSGLAAFPAGLSQTFSVAAVDIQLERASYSNFGPTIDLAAPGGFLGTDINGDGFPDGILSTSARERGTTIDSRYTFASGTSLAAPQVAGVAALVLAANPQLSADDVRQILATTAVDLGAAGRDDEFGNGLLDAVAAVREARIRAGVTVNSDPVLELSPDTLDFGTNLTELCVRVFNAGGGFLDIDRVTALELDGEGWLRANLRGSTSSQSSADEVLITVNRNQLQTGVYRGTVAVFAENVEPAEVNILMEVGLAEEIGEPIVVQARQAETYEVVAESTIACSGECAFLLADLASGSYVIIAGTDTDDDGQICELGDLCGGFPSVIDAVEVQLDAGDHRSGVDFAVSRRLLRQASGRPAAQSLSESVCRTCRSRR